MIRSARVVRKRDGREVPFEQAKIVSAIWSAARSVGGGDRLLAEELGSVVAMFIEREFQDRTPSIDDVSDLIEKVLVETGHARTAKAYILERERRDRIRQALRVRDDAAGALPFDGYTRTSGTHAHGNPRGVLGFGISPAVDAHARGSVSPWSKAKIIEALILEAEVPNTVAAEIASEVERRVFASGITRISTSLVRALVDNELFERGYTRWLDRQGVLGLPRYDLDRMARGGVELDSASAHSTPYFGTALDGEVARATWSQYSLLEIYPQPVVEAHSAGRIHLGCLAAPSRFQSLAIDLSKIALERLALPLPPQRAERAGLQVSDLVREPELLRVIAARATSLGHERIVLEGLENAIGRELESGAAPRDVARGFALSLAVPAGPEGVQGRIELDLPIAVATGSREGLAASVAYAEFVQELLSAIARVPTFLAPPAIAFRLEGAADASGDVLAAISLAEVDPERVRIRAGRRMPGLPPVVPLLERVAVNLAHPSLLAPKGDTSAAIAQITTAIEIAAEACEARLRFLASLVGSAAPRERAAAMFGSDELAVGGFEIALAAIDSAARAQTGESVVRDEGREYARSVVAAARGVVARESASRRIPIVLALCDDRVALSRFGRSDAERFPRTRDAAALPHDGTRYVYHGGVPALHADASELPIEKIARIEAELRARLAPSIVTLPYAAVEDRVQFLKMIDPLLREDLLRCA